MSKLIELLNKNKLTLMVALPKNDPELAKAAVGAGADALQLHIHVSGFGSFLAERANLVAARKGLKVPVGIVPGAKTCADEEEMKEIVRMGFDFFNIDFEHAPSFMLQLKGISRVLALNSRYTMDRLMGLESLGAQAMDAAIVPAQEWGKEMVVGDLQNYIAIVISAGIPVIIPTQRSVKSSEVAIIADTGAKGLLLTSTVIGTTAKHIEKATQEFRAAIDDLS